MCLQALNLYGKAAELCLAITAKITVKQLQNTLSTLMAFTEHFTSSIMCVGKVLLSTLQSTLSLVNFMPFWQSKEEEGRQMIAKRKLDGALDESSRNS